MNRPGRHEQVEPLLSAYLDDELTQAEAQRVELHLEECDECRSALREMKRIQELTAEIEFVQPPDEALDVIAQRLSVRAPRWGGWLLVVIGLIAWVAYGLFLALRHPRWPTAGELLAGLVLIGLALVFVSVLRQRLLERRQDRYRRVRR